MRSIAGENLCSPILPIHFWAVLYSDRNPETVLERDSTSMTRTG
jgi:hypothetical protein